MRHSRSFFLVAVLALLGCGGAAPEPAVETAPQVDAQGRVTLRPAQLRNLGITAVAATAATVVPIAGVPARITAPLAASTEVTLPYAGVVTRVLVDEGQDVRRGQPLLRVQSREAVAVQAELARAQAEAGLAGRQAGRDAQLLAEGLITQARAQESATRVQVARANVAQASAQMAQLRPYAAGLPGEFVLLAPQSGRAGAADGRRGGASARRAGRAGAGHRGCGVSAGRDRSGDGWPQRAGSGRRAG